MFHRLLRLFALAVVVLPLGACIISGYDISSDLKPEFPIKPGAYVNKEDAIVDITRVGNQFGNQYRIVKRRTKDVSYARLFKIPEHADYVVQFIDRKDRLYYYMFLKMTDNGFDFYDVEKEPDIVPEHVKALLKPITDDDRKYNNIRIANGKRDTLYVIREVSRGNFKMVRDEKESYARLPPPKR